ncbi:unnamed protein product [Adineta steineri]|uniref:NHL repeat containing protein n=1 Tax=Adineta steineri TaxID=433720 RepID=A0A814YT87_9BILA|nr:unnamed protein product [Adineta steineri]
MNDDFHSISDKITSTSTNQSRISYRKELVWITFGVIIILIIVSITILLPFIMIKNKNTSQITTITTTITTTTATATATTTEELSFTSMSNNNYLKWKLDFSIVAGGNGYGSNLNQASLTRGIYIDDDNQTIYITQYNSDRIVGWKFGEKSGEVVAGGNKQGKKLNQLNNPSDVTVDKKNNLLIICDQGNERVVQWSRQKQIDPKIIIDDIKCNGVTIDNDGNIYVSEGKKHSVKRLKPGETKVTTVAGENGCGYNTNQLNNPAYIFVDEQYSIYVSDHEYGRVTKWIKNAKEGIIVAKEQIPEDSHSPMFYPCGMAVDHFGNVYVSDSHHRRIVRWSKGSTECYIVMNGGNSEHPPVLFNTPEAISLDGEGNLYIADSQDNQILKFDVDVN